MRCLVLLVLAGCVIYHDTVHVKLRDPARIAVSGVLAADAARGDIPATTPPYLHDPLTGSWIDRTGTALDVWCPDCRGVRRVTIDPVPELVLDGTPVERIRFVRDQLQVRFLYRDFSGPRAHRGGHLFVDRIELDLETPLANVESLEGRHDVDPGEHGLGVTDVIVGSVWTAGQLGLAGLAISDHEHGLAAVGGGLAAVGVTFIVWGIRELRAHDEHRAISGGL